MIIFWLAVMQTGCMPALTLLLSPPGSVEALKRYIAARNRVSGDAWLMKDP